MKPRRQPDDQLRKFREIARELGCDEDPEAFKRAVRKLAKAPPAPRERLKKDVAKPT